jgi:hypothetical protein
MACNGNRIDSLKTDNQVLAFLKKTFPRKKHNPYYFDRYYNETIKVADSLKVKKWVKIDIDQNAETDLLVFDGNYLQDIFVVLSKNGNLEKVSACHDDCKYHWIYPVISRINKKPVILLYHQSQYGYDDSTKHFLYTPLAIDTITFWKGRFLNYINELKTYSIQSIKIYNDGICEGECPRIDIKINVSDFENQCSKELQWDSKPKKFVGKLSQLDVKNILSILEYSNFSELPEQYQISCTDQPTTTLTVTYNNRQIKTIQDYGSFGNFTLAEIYKITNKIKWVPQ